MKNISLKTTFTGLLLASGLSLSPVVGADFITIGKNTKVVFTTETIGGKSVTVATAVVKEVGTDGVTTIKQLVEKKVPADGGGGFDVIVEEIESIVTPTSPGVFSVRTITNITTTPNDANGDPTGPPVITPEDDETQNDVVEADLDLPESTEIEVDGDLGTTPAVSGS